MVTTAMAKSENVSIATLLIIQEATFIVKKMEETEVEVEEVLEDDVVLEEEEDLLVRQG